MAKRKAKEEPTDAAPVVPSLRLEWRDPAELAENPANWRRHPEAQIAAISDVIGEVGWAGACLYNERTKRLIDGHARRKVALEQGAKSVPVLIGSWDDATEAKILATLDPLAAMAEADAAALNKLLAEVETESEPIIALLESLSQDGVAEEEPETVGEDRVPEKYQVLIECTGERQQGELLEELESRGLKVRSLLS